MKRYQLLVRAQIADHDHPDRPQRLIDEPLYVEVIEPEVRE